eukprot:UN05776
MSTHNAANYLDHEAASIATNTLEENVNKNEDSHSRKSFKEVRQFDIKQWELRIDPTSKMRLLYNRIEHKNYWPWQYPKVAKTLGVDIPKKKIFQHASIDDPKLEMANAENELIPPPPPPPIDAIPCAPTDDDINNIEENDEYEYYYEEQEYEKTDENKALPVNNNVGLPPPSSNPNDDNN